MDLFSIFVSWQLVMLCLSTNVVVFIVRTVLDGQFPPDTKRGHLYTTVALPLLPIFIGSVLAWAMVSLSLPITGTLSRVLFGAIAGKFSGLMFQIIKGVLKKQLGPDVVSDEDIVSAEPNRPEPHCPPPARNE